MKMRQNIYITDKKYDVVILNEVLYYIPNLDKQTLRYLEMLKPKGSFNSI